MIVFVLVLVNEWVIIFVLVFILVHEYITGFQRWLLVQEVTGRQEARPRRRCCSVNGVAGVNELVASKAHQTPAFYICTWLASTMISWDALICLTACFHRTDPRFMEIMVVFTPSERSAVVTGWRLHCQFLGAKALPHLEFHRQVTLTLIKCPNYDRKQLRGGPQDSLPATVPCDGDGHIRIAFVRKIPEWCASSVRPGCISWQRRRRTGPHVANIFNSWNTAIFNVQ